MQEIARATKLIVLMVVSMIEMAIKFEIAWQKKNTSPLKMAQPAADEEKPEIEKPNPFPCAIASHKMGELCACV